MAAILFQGLQHVGNSWLINSNDKKKPTSVNKLRLFPPPSLGLRTQRVQRQHQRNVLGPSTDGSNYAVVHCTGYIKNWPPTGMQMGLPDAMASVDNDDGDKNPNLHCCMVSIGRLQVHGWGCTLVGAIKHYFYLLSLKAPTDWRICRMRNCERVIWRI